MAGWDDVIWCDNAQALLNPCGSAFARNEQRARAKGWHIWEGETMGGKHQRIVLCPRCIGTSRSRLPSEARPLQDDQTLF